MRAFVCRVWPTAMVDHVLIGDGATRVRVKELMICPQEAIADRSSGMHLMYDLIMARVYALRCASVIAASCLRFVIVVLFVDCVTRLRVAELLIYPQGGHADRSSYKGSRAWRACVYASRVRVSAFACACSCDIMCARAWLRGACARHGTSELSALGRTD